MDCEGGKIHVFSRKMDDPDPKSPYATSTFPIMHLICPPKFFLTFVFSFLLGITAVPREIENNAYAKFGGANKVRYGKCRSGVLDDQASYQDLSFREETLKKKELDD